MLYWVMINLCIYEVKNNVTDSSNDGYGHDDDSFVTPKIKMIKISTTEI